MHQLVPIWPEHHASILKLNNSTTTIMYERNIEGHDALGVWQRPWVDEHQGEHLVGT